MYIYINNKKLKNMKFKKTTLSIITALTISVNADELFLPEILKREIEKPSFLVQLEYTPKIQIGIILDTSNSMDGLINQARNKIWEIINEVSKANKNNKKVIMEVSLIEYGKSTNKSDEGFVKILSNLTSDLDFLSEQLFSINTKGGDEYAGIAIFKSINELNWSNNDEDLKILVIAGNESFYQGGINPNYAISKANVNNIIVNSIFCGSYEDGVKYGWKKAIDISGGKYLNINQNQKIINIETPYDIKISKLGSQLNETYIGYNDYGNSRKVRQIAQDSMAEEISMEVVASRTMSKISNSYKSDSDSWDIIALYDKDKSKAVEKLSEVKIKGFENLSKDELEKKLSDISIKRISIESEIKELQLKRSDFIKEYGDKNKDDFSSKLF
jgi:hypothetical protein